MRIITLNLNGVRSASNKGFFHWLPKQGADIVCVQELKAQTTDLTSDMLTPNNDHGYFHCAERKGYSGVGIFCLRKPNKTIEGVGITEIDTEGRYLRADFDHLSIISVYLPSGSSGEHRQTAKFFFLKHFFPLLKKLIARGREVILCGDWNIAHKEIDLKTGDLIRKILAFCRKSVPGLPKVSINSGLSMYSGKSTKNQISTHGGPIEDKLGQKT